VSPICRVEVNHKWSGYELASCGALLREDGDSLAVFEEGTMGAGTRTERNVTYFTDELVSPYSFFSVICRNWIAACCLEQEGCATGISVT